MILALRNIEKSFGQNTLFQNVSFEVEENDKIGFVGMNGTGKTTLFHVITGEMAYDSGEVLRPKLLKTAYMEQQSLETPIHSVYEEVLIVFRHLSGLEAEIENVRQSIENKTKDIQLLIRQQHSLQNQYEEQGGYLYKSRVKAVLLGLGFTQSEMELPLSNLSGGQRTRVMLAKILLDDANLLLLDEPTNHLDIASVEWLEDYLKSYKGAFIVISHDRYFLDRVTTRTLALENRRITAYGGNYSYYVSQKEEDNLYLERKYENTQKEITRLKGVIEQQKRWNREKNIVTAESKQKVVDKLEKTLIKPDAEVQNIRFAFTKKERGGNDVLIAQDLKKSYGDKLLFQNVNLHIKKGERVFLLGPNGCGKTTLFKTILGQAESEGGWCKTGSHVEAGYYDQMQSGLNGDNTILEEISIAYPDMKLKDIRNALAAFLFKEDDVFKKIELLSGGEKARVALLKLMLSKANFLLLDEPTNHLDIGSCEALENAMKGYDGTLFIISHDRYFINKLSDRILSFMPDISGLTEFCGSYDGYIQSVTQKPAAGIKEQPKISEYQLKKEKEAAKRRLLGQIARAEKSIHEAEEKIKQWEVECEKEENASDYEKIISLTEGIESCKKNIDALYETWERLHMELNESDEDTGLLRQ